MGEISLQQQVARDVAMSSFGFVYFIAAPPDYDPIKIGFTTDPQTRLAAYVQHSPIELHLLGLAAGSQAVERRLHRRFAIDRRHGEWFASSAALVSLVESHRYGDGIPIRSIDDRVFAESEARTRRPQPTRSNPAEGRSRPFGAYRAPRGIVRTPMTRRWEDTPYQRALEAQRLADLLAR